MEGRSRSRESYKDDKRSKGRDSTRNRNRKESGSRSRSESASSDDKVRSRSRDNKRNSKQSKYYEKEDKRSKYRKGNSRSRSRNRHGSSESEDKERCQSRSRDRRHNEDENRKNKGRDDKSRSRSRDNKNVKRHGYQDRRRNSRSRSRESGQRERYNYKKKDRRDFRRSSSFDTANAKWGKNDTDRSYKKEESKDKPNFGLSGKLTEERNTYKGIVIKYSEPPEARKPKRRWRLYPFKGEKALQTLYIHRESAYLIGRERKVVDLPVDHPSCSKQHAALQYRLVPFTREDGSVGKRVRPYLIDLESANGTFINNKKIDPKKYVELLERDVIKFGFSSREYVLLHENSKDEAMDDDVKQEEEVKVKNEAD